MIETIRIQNLRDFTVQVRDPKNKMVVGTGIVISMEGKIATCAHVVELALGVHPREARGKSLYVYFPQVKLADRKLIPAIVEAFFQDYDDDVT